MVFLLTLQIFLVRGGSLGVGFAGLARASQAVNEAVVAHRCSNSAELLPSTSTIALIFEPR